MIIRKHKCLLVLIVTLGMFAFLLSGCGSGNQEQSQKSPTQEVSKETGNEETTKEATTDVPGTSISLYPGAQLVYNDDEQIVYATNASLDDLFNFYKDFSELKSLPASRTEELFGLETELFRMIRNVGRIDVTDESAINAYEKELQDEVSKSGRLLTFLALQADSNEINRVFNDADIISQLPIDGNILQFRFWIND